MEETTYILVRTPVSQVISVPCPLTETARELLERVAYMEGIESSYLFLHTAGFRQLQPDDKISEYISKPEEVLTLVYRMVPMPGVSAAAPLAAALPRPTTGSSHIYIKRLKGGQQHGTAVAVDFTDTLSDLKRKLVTQENVPYERIRLVCGGKELHGESSTLSALGLAAESTIFLVERVGAPPQAKEA